MIFVIVGFPIGLRGCASDGGVLESNFGGWGCTIMSSAAAAAFDAPEIGGNCGKLEGGEDDGGDGAVG